MKDKIFNRLKQEYAPLGLDESTLLGLAESLAALGYVTDENIQGVVAGQKAYLEAMQKNIDKRVQNAVTKVKGESNKAQEDKIADLERQLAEAKKAATGKHDDDDIPDWAKKEREEREAREKEWQKKIAELEKAKADADKEKAEAEAARIATARKQNIEKKAKEKGIPDWMYRHGFADIPDDADDAKIEEILSGYANEIQAHFLPNRRSLGQGGEKTATKAETDAIVAKMFPNRGKKEEQ